MSGLEFTDEAARQLEKAYLSRDVIAQRSETIRHLNLSPGERVLDIGCGPGFLCESMGVIVGHQGAVVGVDVSADLVARCNGRKTSTWLSYEVGDATKLRQSDASFDAVVCTQVAEYITDVDRVFSEAFRVLKPNGRTIFVATDWHTILWYSDNLRRMAAVMTSWEGHSAHPRLTKFQHCTIISEDVVENLVEGFMCPAGPAFMAMEAWASSVDEAADMARSIGNDIGFTVTGRIYVYKTDQRSRRERNHLVTTSIPLLFERKGFHAILGEQRGPVDVIN